MRLLPVVLVLVSSTAAAQVEEGPVAGAGLVSASDGGAFLPVSMAAQVARNAAVAFVYGGYDSPRETAIFEATAEVKLFGPVALRGGAVYTSAAETLKPFIGARAQFLEQRKAGVDMSIGVFYKPEGFTEPEGEIEAVLAAGMRFGDAYALLDLVYGQDAEATERDGEVRAAFLYRLSPVAQIGFDARLRFDLGEEEMETAGKAEFDLVAGPVGGYVVGPVALLAQVGVSVLGEIKTGVVALAGIGTTF